jgi:ElaB/YqjD/DUF883 family membrane-anchored ribosome-binding protein
MGERADEIRRRQQDVSPVDRDAAAYQEESDPDAIRSDIEQTRAEMTETIDAIQERFDPQHLKEQAKEQVREQAQEAKVMIRDATVGRAERMLSSARESAKGGSSSMLETIKENPIPAALAGIGIGWLLMNRRSSATGGQIQYQSQSTTGETVGRAQEQAGQITSQAQERAGQMASQAQERAEQMAGQARYQARRAEDRFQQMLQENPLAVGAVALAVGAAVGLAVPETRKEHELMGETRDSLMQQAKSTAQDTLQRAERVAEEAQRSATQAAKQEAKEQGLSS